MGKTEHEIAKALQDIGDEFALPTGELCDAVYAIASERDRLSAENTRLKEEQLARESGPFPSEASGR